MPSELVNSVISKPQPPSPRMTRRKSVSVTPAMGARTAAGRIVRSRIWKLAGIIYLSLGWCGPCSKMARDSCSASRAPKGATSLPRPLARSLISRYYLDMLRFDWDEQKNKRNRTKHGVWFEEAQSVFSDPQARLFHDPEHSESEDRFILLGVSSAGRTLA